MNLTALAGPGLDIRTGALTCRIRSRLPQVAQAIRRLYAHHPSRPAQGFADFHVEVRRARGLRGWIKPQVDFYIDGERPFKPLPLEQAFALLEWGLNWCVASHCHQFLVLHAASLAKNNRAVILPGAPGAGKSTLCAALMLAGWRLLSDELTLIEPASGTLRALARPINLKNAAIELIRTQAPTSTFGPVVKDTQKGRISHLCPTPASVQQADLPATPRWVIFPRYQAGAALDITPAGRATSLMMLAEQAFNYTTLGRRGFETAAALIDHCMAYSLRYSDLPQALSFFESLADDGHLARGDAPTRARAAV